MRRPAARRYRSPRPRLIADPLKALEAEAQLMAADVNNPIAVAVADRPAETSELPDNGGVAIGPGQASRELAKRSTRGGLAQMLERLCLL